MAYEIQRFPVTVPHGTAIATPQRTAMTMPARVVRRLEIMVPPGPAGFVGFQITSNGKQVVPVNDGTWLVTDDETLTFDLTDTITSGAWQLTAYNTGTYDHTLYVTFHVDPPQVTQPVQAPAMIPNAALSGSM